MEMKDLAPVIALIFTAFSLGFGASGLWEWHQASVLERLFASARYRADVLCRRTSVEEHRRRIQRQSTHRKVAESCLGASALCLLLCVATGLLWWVVP